MIVDALSSLKSRLMHAEHDRWSLSYRVLESPAKQAEIREQLQNTKKRHVKFLDLFNQLPASPVYRYALFGNLTEWARLASLIQYDSANEATQSLQEVLNEMEPFKPLIGDELYTVWRDYTVIITQTIKRQSLTLPHIIHADVTQPMPALLVAYEVYEDSSRESDVIARNQIPHSAFVTGTLELLSE